MGTSFEAYFITMMCKNCSFKSPEYKLYEEIKTNKPGPNPAAVNMMFQAGPQDTPMGNTRARYLLAVTDIPPPSKTSMQRVSNIVGKATVELNEIDMIDKLKLVRQVNVMHGVQHPEQINVAFDVRYNAIRFGPEKNLVKVHHKLLELPVKLLRKRNTLWELQ
jgi:hypothetical protein